MTNHIKVGTYTNSVNTCLTREKHLDNIQAIKNQKVHRARQQATNPYRKVRLVHEKEKKKRVVYIQHDECDVDNKTKCYVYFDARYTDPNMCYNEETGSWFHYSTPGLFRNVRDQRAVCGQHQQLDARATATASSHHHHLNRVEKGYKGNVMKCNHLTDAV